MVIIIVVAAAGFVFFVYPRPQGGLCTFNAGPLGLGLRVVSDGNQTPIAGAQVEATNTALLCDGAPADSQKTTSFVTNGTEWNYLDIGEDASYSFLITYSGHSYNFSTGLGVEAFTCATLFLPSGRTNVTFAEFQNGCPSATTTTVTSTAISATVIVPQGTTYQVQSSYDCLAGHSAQPFNVTTTSLLEGAITAGQPGVTIYITTAQDAQELYQGHPEVWLYSSGLTNSTSFSLDLAPGSYVIWTEGADLGCGATVVTPLEQLTTVTVTQEVSLGPPGGGTVIPE